MSKSRDIDALVPGRNDANAMISDTGDGDTPDGDALISRRVDVIVWC